MSRSGRSTRARRGGVPADARDGPLRGALALDLSKNVENPGTKSALIVSKQSGRVFPPPPPGGALVQAATAVYEQHGKPEYGTPEWHACVVALGVQTGRRMCHGFAGQRGIPCTARPIEGRDFCLKHGGTLAAGTDHGHFVDGTSAGRKHLARLTDEQRTVLRAARPQNRTELLGLAQSADEQELWARIAADPLNTDAGPHLASVDLRIARRLKTLREKDGTNDQWMAVNDAVKAFAESTRRAEDVQALLVALTTAIHAWGDNEQQIAAIREEEMHWSFLQKAEVKRQEIAAKGVTMDLVKLFAAALLAAVHDEVKDPEIVRALQARVFQAYQRHIVETQA